MTQPLGTTTSSRPSHRRIRSGRRRQARLVAVALVVAWLPLVPQLVAPTAAAPQTGSVDRRIAVGSDDAEELANGTLDASSSDLELVYDGGNQQVGMRFPDMTVPAGAVITRAYVQFEADEVQSEATALTIKGQAADNAVTFSSTNKISSRARTSAAASWSPVPWTVVSAAGADQRTPDLSAVVQEIVDRPGWTSGNALALLVTGTGHRTARAYNGKPTGAPLLHVEYTFDDTAPAPNRAPVVDAGVDQTVTLPGSATLDGTVTDDGQPAGGSLSTTWTQVSGPGTTAFGDAIAVDTTATFSAPGTYTLRLTADDGALSASDTVDVVVRPEAAPGSGTTIMGAGDIAASGSLEGLNARATGDLIRESAPDAAFTLGDNAYDDGSLDQYQSYYDPAWGSFKSMTHPVPGNHEYHQPDAPGYVGYFGAANVTNPVDGGLYYAWNVGNGWRAYAVNTEISTSGAQLTWLRNDVAAHPGMHYILYTHHPRYTSGSYNYATTAVCPLWNALAATGGLEIVMAGHQHDYERFARMDCAGATTDSGARSFVVGSGGNWIYSFGAPQPGSEFRNATDYGVLRLVLEDSSYSWSFIASGRGWDGSTSVDTHNKWQVLDSGTQTAHDIASPGNTAPAVNAGPDQTITMPASASLDGTVTDDGLPNPPGSVTSTWSEVSGPGTVTFADANAIDTNATFSEAGAYELRLTGNDSDATSSDTVVVSVQPAPGTGTTGTAEVRISTGTNDVEQALSGAVDLGSTDLELTTDGSVQQVVGTRFPGLAVPQGATITRAYVQFQVDEVSTDASSLTIRAENSDNAPVYTSTNGSVTARPVTGNVAWTPPAWPTVGAAGADQRSSDVSTLVQAVVNRTGWAPGNALALQISGTGRRTAEAFEGSAPGAPLLHVEYTTSGGGTPTNSAPVVDAGTDQTITMPSAASLDGTVTDDGLPNPPGTVTTTWTQASGPGTTTFTNPNNVDTTATFTSAGTYVLRLTADDTALTTVDTVQVTVLAAPPPGSGTIERQVAASSDDAEESAAGSYSGTSSDLELVHDADDQLVGLRFTNLAIPKGATITRAYVQFFADEKQSETTSLTIRGQAADNAATFASSNKISTRTRTAAAAPTWSPPAWTLVGEAGPDQRTTDVSAVVQEIVNRSGWASGNALVLIIGGTGHRTARAFDKAANVAPIIHIEYSVG